MDLRVGNTCNFLMNANAVRMMKIYVSRLLFSTHGLHLPHSVSEILWAFQENHSGWKRQIMQIVPLSSLRNMVVHIAVGYLCCPLAISGTMVTSFPLGWKGSRPLKNNGEAIFFETPKRCIGRYDLSTGFHSWHVGVFQAINNSDISMIRFDSLCATDGMGVQIHTIFQNSLVTFRALVPSKL